MVWLRHMILKMMAEGCSLPGAARWRCPLRYLEQVTRPFVDRAG